jgi:hypothetical protein
VATGKVHTDPQGKVAADPLSCKMFASLGKSSLILKGKWLLILCSLHIT